MLSQRSSQATAQKLKQQQRVTPQQLLYAKLLEKSLPELRDEIVAEMQRNPTIEDIGHSIESPISEVEHEHSAEFEVPDYPEEDFTPLTSSPDVDSLERRQAFLDSRPAPEETLQQHLLDQLPYSDIAPEDYQLASVLIGDLDDKGWYIGSVPDMMMSFGKSKDSVEAILGAIMQLDPIGCGARTAKECLLAQIEPGFPHEEALRALINDHLEDVAAKRRQIIAADVRIGEDVDEVIRLLRTLDPMPGRNYASERDRVEYINPEVHAVMRDGKWVPETDSRSLPEIHISSHYLEMLKDPKQTAEVREYVRSKIEAAQRLREAVEKRHQTVKLIAEEIFKRQQAFFTEGYKALVPMKELDIATELEVSPATVSRTVKGKYAETLKGTIELRRFFTTAVSYKGDKGEVVAQDKVIEKLREIIEQEDSAHPMSDQALAKALGEFGYHIARRTVAKYRERLGIPGTAERRLVNKRDKIGSAV